MVATPAWWDLTAIEKNLLSLMVAFNNSCSTFDIPVFLPVKSPKVIDILLYLTEDLYADFNINSSIFY